VAHPTPPIYDAAALQLIIELLNPAQQPTTAILAERPHTFAPVSVLAVHCRCVLSSTGMAWHTPT
jgi:hypothetical protein